MQIHMASTRQHELDHTDHTDHTDQEWICPEISIDRAVADGLSFICALCEILRAIR